MASIKEAAIEILRKESPLHYSEITKKISDRNIIKFKSKNPQISVYSTINEDLKENGENSPFVRGKSVGFFGINGLFDFERYDSLGKNLSLKRDSRDFERRMKSLLEKMEFDKVDGARDDFIVGGHQIDVAAMHQKSIIVFECKMWQKRLRKKA